MLVPRNYTRVFLSSGSTMVTYQLISQTLTISGNGEITQEGIRSQGDYTMIQAAIIEEGISSIESAAFSECLKLQTVSIPSTVTKIGSFIFFRCNSLSLINVSDDNPNFSNGLQHGLFDKKQTCLYRAPTIQNFIIPETVTKIVNGAFRTERTYNMGDIILPNSLNNYETDAFAESSFNKITYADSPNIKIIPASCFSYMRATSIMIPKSCITIEEKAFSHTQVDELIFQSVSLLNEIKNSSFESTRRIQSIVLPDSLQIINPSAFEGSDVQYIYIGSSCKSISNSAFSRCASLSEIEVSPTNEFFTSFNGMIMDKENTTILFIPQTNTTITIPETIIMLGETLLQSQNKLTEIKLLNKDVWDTEDGVLYSNDFSSLIAVCGGKTSVTVHSGVSTIAPKAAQGCTNLKQFLFNDKKCTSLNDYCLSGSGITSFIIPSSVQTIGNYAFSSCSYLSEIIIADDSELTSIGENAFYQLNRVTKLFIPPKLKSLGDYAFSTSGINNITFAADSIFTSFSSSCFSYSNLQSITIPRSLEKINNNCFGYCSNLEKVSFQCGTVLKEIGEDAFIGCAKLGSIELPPSCTTIGTFAFSQCTGLSYVYHFLPQITANSFKDCTSLENFYISENTTQINPSAFSGCISLTKFNVNSKNQVFSVISGFLFDINGQELIICPPGIKYTIAPRNTSSIALQAFTSSSLLRTISFINCPQLKEFGSNLFENCVSLIEIQFPPILERIGKSCFVGCTSLKAILLPSLLRTIQSNAFSGCTSLKTVAYCGTEEITGLNVFVNTRVEFISVTPNYNSTKFCSLRVDHGLDNNCLFPKTQGETCAKSHFLSKIPLFVYVIVTKL